MVGQSGTPLWCNTYAYVYVDVPSISEAHYPPPMATHWPRGKEERRKQRERHCFTITTNNNNNNNNNKKVRNKIKTGTPFPQTASTRFVS